jgi:phosphoribosylformylglycinamidine synthase
MIQSAHDISEGGLFTTLMESAMVNNLGFDVETDGNFRKDAYLFGESQSRVVVSCTLALEDELVNYLNSHNVPFTKLGEVTGAQVVIDREDFGALNEWKALFDNYLAEKMEA